MKRAAVFIKNYSIGKSSPVICMLDLLSDNYKVDIFAQNVWYLSTPVLKKGNINLIELEDLNGKWVLNSFKRALNFLSGKNPFDAIRSNIDHEYQCYICFDPHAFVLCKQLFPAAKPFYYSLELYFKDNFFNLTYPEEVMKSERNRINTIAGLIIQSREREMLFRHEYQLSNEIPAFLLPVTYLKPSVREKSTALREKYGIGGRKIALHLGGIQEYHSCIELALEFSRVDDCVLIFHGFHFGNYIKRLKKCINDARIKNVIISEETYDQIDDMDQVLKASDLGIAWYNNVSPNFATAGKSSGKISAYLRFGLPVIANKYPSTIGAIEETGCGVCVSNFEEIPEAVRKITGNYEYYSENCRREYDEVYWFENYREKLLRFLGQ